MYFWNTLTVIEAVKETTFVCKITIVTTTKPSKFISLQTFFSDQWDDLRILCLYDRIDTEETPGVHLINILHL